MGRTIQSTALARSLRGANLGHRALLTLLVLAVAAGCTLGGTDAEDAVPAQPAGAQTSEASQAPFVNSDDEAATSEPAAKQVELSDRLGPVSEFQVEVDGDTVILSWGPPAEGTVSVFAHQISPVGGDQGENPQWLGQTVTESADVGVARYLSVPSGTYEARAWARLDGVDGLVSVQEFTVP